MRSVIFMLILALCLTSCQKGPSDLKEKDALVHLKFEQAVSSTYEEVIANYQKLDSAWPEAKLLECGPTDCGKPLH